MARTVVQKTIRGLIAIGVLFVVAIMSMAFLTYRLADLDYWTRHTHIVLEELQRSLSSLQDVETGERGFLYTGAKEFLEPYQWGSEAAMRTINNVQSLTEDNPEQQKAVLKLRELADQKLALAKVDILEERLADPAKVLIAQRKGKEIMDAFRVQVKLMSDSESALLKQRVSDMRFTQAAICAATGLLAVFAIGLLAWVFRITRSAIEDEKRRVAELNAEIEQRARIEKALKLTTVNLTRSNADLQQFAYVASHDLQEPLRAIAGFLTLLSSRQANKLDSDSKRYINHAVEGAERMRALVNDLLSYARVESRAKDFQKVDLVKILERVKTDLSVQIQETGATIIEDELPSVEGDPIQLGQLFQNLIGNAIKFRSSQAPAVRVGCVNEKTEFIFSVKDNGRGFDMEHAERVFVIFQRLQGRDEAAGTGIGLAVCKKIVERHNGRIWVESKPNEGTTFFFTLPKQQGDA